MSNNEIEIAPPPRSFENRNIGDSHFSNFNKPMEDPLPIPIFPTEFKISYPPSMETQIRKLRLSLETWREVVLRTNSILQWEKQWHPTAIMGACTVLFMLLWLFELNILTVLSLLGLFITIGDYILPTVVATVFKSEEWTQEKQNEFEEICTNLILYKTKLELLLTSYYRMRVTNSKMYFSITISALAILAWIGSTINNLFLTYALVLFILLLPGMSRNGMLNKTSETLSKIFTDLVENAKSKVGQKKIQ